MAGPLLGEVVTKRQWLGLGLGLAGVVLVVRTKLELGLGTPMGMTFAMICMASITTGTLAQKKFCGGMDLRTGSVIQFIASFLLVLPIGWWLEGLSVQPSLTLLYSMLWLCVVLSIGAVTLMFILIRRGAAAEVASLFFLVPPTTAVLGWLAFGERVDLPKRRASRVGENGVDAPQTAVQAIDLLNDRVGGLRRVHAQIGRAHV